MTQETFKNTIFILKDDMFRFARSLLISTEEAEDVVQDLMVKFWQKKDELSSINIKSYAMKSVKNECLNRLKHHEIKMGFAQLQKQHTEFDKPEINNLREEIIKIINQLPEKQRLTIHLKDVEEYEVSEISEILDMEPNAVRLNLMRARQKIKTQVTHFLNYENRTL